MELLVAFCAAIAVFMLLAYFARARAPQPAEARLRQITDGGRPSGLSLASVPLLRRPASSIPALSRALDTGNYASRWAFDLERAGSRLRSGEYFLIRVTLAAVALVVVMLIGQSALAFFIGLAAAAFAYMLPAFWIGMRIRNRTERISQQIPEAVGLIANALKAGFAFSQGVDAAAQRVGPPMSVELNRMLLDIGLGASTEDALQAMNRRIGSDDMELVVSAVLIQRNSGGNLAEVLDGVTETMRERDRIRGEIKTLTASQRFTGWVLSLWPIVLAFVFWVIAPDVMSLLWTTEGGRVLLGIWIVLNLLGIFALRQILRIDV